VFPSQIEELILAEPALAPHYVLELTREGRLDCLTVRVEARAAPDAEVGRALQHRIKAMIGVTVSVEVVAPGAVERSTGKAKRVIDKRGGSG
jgi:phenylacetate-CoA ligase